MNHDKMKMSVMTNLLTLEEAAKYLRMGKSTLDDLARKRNVHAHETGRVRRFDAAEPDEWLKGEKADMPKNNLR